MNKSEYEKLIMNSNLHGIARLIALVCAYHSKWDTGEGIYVSQETIAKESGYTRRTVNTYMQMLIDNGYLEIAGRASHGQYVLRLSEPDENVVHICEAVSAPEAEEQMRTSCTSEPSDVNLMQSDENVVHTNLTEPYSQENFTVTDSHSESDITHEDSLPPASPGGIGDSDSSMKDSPDESLDLPDSMSLQEYLDKFDDMDLDSLLMSDTGSAGINTGTHTVKEYAASSLCLKDKQAIKEILKDTQAEITNIIIDGRLVKYLSKQGKQQRHFVEDGRAVASALREQGRMVQHIPHRSREDAV